MRFLFFHLIFVLSFCQINSDLISKEKFIRVFYNDKGPEEFAPGSNLYEQTMNTLTDRAIQRRLKVKELKDIITYEDVPVYEPYIIRIEKLGAKSIHHLKWRNYSVFLCDSNLVKKISKLKFVKSVQFASQKIPVFLSDTSDTNVTVFRNFNIRSLFISEREKTSIEKFYGNSYIQNNLIGADILHSLGIIGEGVLIGFMDSGFNWKDHEAMSNADVILERDFIQLDSNTEDEKDDVDGQDGHGTLCFSAVSGFYQGELIGISQSSSFILCKTESIPQEIHLEEDNYAAAMELIESLGADVSSSSLAYLNFDEVEQNYSFEELNGSTSISAIVINNAVARGMICVTAAGNTGPNPSTLLTPADADSAIAVGAVKVTSTAVLTADFSSRGPRGDSVAKPDIAALGVKVACATPKTKDKFMTANGTSLATPIVAGSIGLMLSCFPELTPFQVRELIYSTAISNKDKNNSLGHGILNIYDAMRNAGTIISPPVIYKVKNHLRILFNIVPMGSMISNPILVIDNNGSIEKFALRKQSDEYQYVCDISLDFIGDFTSFAYLIVKTSEDTRRFPYDIPAYFNFSRETRRIPNNIDENTLPGMYLSDNVVFNQFIKRDDKEPIRIKFELEKASQIIVKVVSCMSEVRYQTTQDILYSGIYDLDIPVDNFSSGVYQVSITTNHGIHNSQLHIY